MSESVSVNISPTPSSEDALTVSQPKSLCDAPPDVPRVNSSEASLVPVTSTAAASVHIFKAFVGSSVFMVPRYLALAGCILGPIIMWVMAAAAYDCTIMHLRVHQKIALPDVRDYADVVGFVFGPRARRACGISIVFLSICWIIVFFQLAAGMVSEIFDSRSAYTLTVLTGGALTLLFSLFSNDIGRLAWISGVSIAAGIVLILVTFSSAANTLLSSGVHPTVVVAVQSPQSIVSFFSTWTTVVFIVPAVLPIYTSMAATTRSLAFPVLFRNVMLGVMLLHTTYGLIGYFAYGSTITSATVSMLPRGVWWADSLRCLLAFTMITSIPIALVPAAIVADAIIGIPVGTAAYRDPRALAVRATAVLFTTLVALVFGADQVVLVAEYVGATLCVGLMFIVPVLLDLCVERALANPKEDRGAWSYWQPLLADYTIWIPTSWSGARHPTYVVGGCLLMIMGLATAIRDTISLLGPR